MIKCSECKKDIIKETKYMDWLKLVSFLEFLYYEDYIEEETYKMMMDKLLTFKPYASEEFDS